LNEGWYGRGMYFTTHVPYAASYTSIDKKEETEKNEKNEKNEKKIKSQLHKYLSSVLPFLDLFTQLLNILTSRGVSKENPIRLGTSPTM